MANSWEATKQSWGVLKQDKELLAFPIFSFIASLIMIATFVAPAYFTGVYHRATETDPGDPNAQALLAVTGFVLYFILSFITVYFNAALIFGANERLSGGDPTIGSSLRGANKRIGKILAWSAFAATVSLLIQVIESALRKQNDMLGRIVGSILGTAWSLATFFVIPVVLFEDKRVFGSLKRSGQLFKQRWGESLVGQYGIGFVFGLIGIAVILVTVLLIMAVGGLGVVGSVLGLTILAAGILAFLVVILVGTAMGSVYRVALYRFAAEGQVPPGFTPSLVQNAYVSKGH